MLSAGKPASIKGRRLEDGNEDEYAVVTIPWTEGSGILVPKLFMGGYYGLALGYSIPFCTATSSGRGADTQPMTPSSLQIYQILRGLNHMKKI